MDVNIYLVSSLNYLIKALVVNHKLLLPMSKFQFSACGNYLNKVPTLSLVRKCLLNKGYWLNIATCMLYILVSRHEISVVYLIVTNYCQASTVPVIRDDRYYLFQSRSRESRQDLVYTSVLVLGVNSLTWPHYLKLPYSIHLHSFSCSVSQIWVQVTWEFEHNYKCQRLRSEEIGSSKTA